MRTAFAKVPGSARRRQRLPVREAAPGCRPAQERSSTKPTDRQNTVERGVLLWDWINAYSLTGGPVPANATQDLAPVFELRDGDGDAASRRAANMQRLTKAIDDLIYEFRIKDEHPKATAFHPRGQGRSISRIELADHHPDADLRRTADPAWQHTDAGEDADERRRGAAARRSGRRQLRLDPVLESARALRQDARCLGGNARRISAATSENAAFRVEGEAVQPGDTVTLVYGDRSHGSRGLLMPSFSNDKYLLPIYVSLKADEPAADARLAADERRRQRGRRGQSVRAFDREAWRALRDLAVRSEDERWNRATGSIPGYELSLNGKSVRTIPAGTDGLSVLKDLQIDQPGTYRFTARSADGKISGESNPIWVEADPKYRIYWGETHAHSGFSEGMGSIDRFYTWGRDDARLDFLGLSEHDIWLDDSEWRAMQDAVRRYTDPGQASSPSWPTSGRRSAPWAAITTSSSARPITSRVPVQMFYNQSRLYYGLRAANKTNDVLIIPHAHQAGDWRRNDPDMERLVEIMSMHGTFEWFGNYYLKNGYRCRLRGGVRRSSYAPRLQRHDAPAAACSSSAGWSP